MQQQVLFPGVQDGERADVGAEPLGVACDFDQGRGCGCEQQIVERSRAGEGKDVELMRYGEDDMEVADGEQFLLPCLEPLLAGPRLALGTAAVAARVEGEAGLQAAVGTHAKCPPSEAVRQASTVDTPSAADS